MNTMRAVRAHRREGPEQLAQDHRFEVAEVDVVRDTAGGDTRTRPWGPLHPGGALCRYRRAAREGAPAWQGRHPCRGRIANRGPGRPGPVRVQARSADTAASSGPS